MSKACGVQSDRKWRQYEIISDPTLADAILDRLVHNAYRLNLKGESMRKKRLTLTSTDDMQ
jgi:DNA replication protein DnaC